MATTALAEEKTELMRRQMRYEDYIAEIDEHTHAEWVNGEVIIFMPPKDSHQQTLGFLHQLLKLFIDTFNLGQVRVAPFEMKLAAQNSYREPDIFFVSTPNLARFTPDRLDGPADLYSNQNET